MIIRGRVQDGVVIPEPGVSLPEGAEVTVMVCTSASRVDEKLPEEERRRVVEVLDRIAALPIEGDPEPFSGADHDKILYGKP